MTQSIFRARPNEKNVSSLAGDWSISGWRGLSAIFLVSGLGLWWAFGSLLHSLVKLWIGNGLASLGILAVPAAAILTVLALRSRKWRANGSWWGLALCALTFLMTITVKNYGIPVLRSSGGALHLLPLGLMIWLYVSGIFLLFAGYEAYRLAFFPLSLLLLVNPAPQFFMYYVDLPLQYVGAHTARIFAGWVGVPLESDHLRLMFSPALGMFIAPGCNGLRGALAMGFLTLIVGYLYRLPLWLRGVYFIFGVILAYLMNLVRLCGLVLCYRVALNVEPLARHMEAADYVLGSLIFFSASIFVFAIPRKWNNLRKQAQNS